jgi:hypothetical protein
MKKKTLYIIIIAILVLLNIGQFVYFYSVVSDLKSELKIMKNNGNDIFDPRYPNRYKI